LTAQIVTYGNRIYRKGMEINYLPMWEPGMFMGAGKTTFTFRLKAFFSRNILEFINIFLRSFHKDLYVGIKESRNQTGVIIIRNPGLIL
jgi:hypothetical protein